MNWSLFWTIALAITIGPLLVSGLFTLTLSIILSSLFWKLIGLIIVGIFFLGIFPTLAGTDQGAVIVAIVLGYIYYKFNQWGKKNKPLHDLIWSNILYLPLSVAATMGFLLMTLTADFSSSSSGAIILDIVVLLILTAFSALLIIRFLQEYKKIKKSISPNKEGN